MPTSAYELVRVANTPTLEGKGGVSTLVEGRRRGGAGGGAGFWRGKLTRWNSRIGRVQPSSSDTVDQGGDGSVSAGESF